VTGDLNPPRRSPVLYGLVKRPMIALAPCGASAWIRVHEAIKPALRWIRSLIHLVGTNRCLTPRQRIAPPGRACIATIPLPANTGFRCPASVSTIVMNGFTLKMLRQRHAEAFYSPARKLMAIARLNRTFSRLSREEADSRLCRANAEFQPADHGPAISRRGCGQRPDRAHRRGACWTVPVRCSGSKPDGCCGPS